MENLITRKASLSEHVVQFCRFLRGKGFLVGPAEEADALKALALIPPDSPERFEAVLRATLVRSPKQGEQFNEWFAYYWNQLEKATDSKRKERPEDRRRKKQADRRPDATFHALKNWLYGQPGEEEVSLAAYSGAEVLTQKDLRSFSDAELEEAMRIIRVIARSLANQYQYSRRFQAHPRGKDFDLRQTMRRNMRRGGEILDIVFRKRKVRKLQLVMLCDVSKSMDLYSQFLVQFIYAFQQIYRRIETFVFSTSLYRITESLQSHRFETAMDRLSREVPGWSGGTRIGQSLHTFVEDYASRMLDKDTVVLILSDGWETGDEALLAEAMEEIQRRCSRLIWLNPLAGNPNFRPEAKGMEAAMPYIDVFLPAHNVDSLRKAMQILLRNHR